jgi:hypothetical protein
VKIHVVCLDVSRRYEAMEEALNPPGESEVTYADLVQMINWHLGPGTTDFTVLRDFCRAHPHLLTQPPPPGDWMSPVWYGEWCLEEHRRYPTMACPTNTNPLPRPPHAVISPCYRVKTTRTEDAAFAVLDVLLEAGADIDATVG